MYHYEMNINSKVLTLIVVASIAAGVLLEKQLIAVKKETDTSTTNNDITTVIKEKQNKDGSVEKDTTIVDKSKKEEKLTTEERVLPPNWFVSVGAGLDSSVNTVYLASVNRRILGPIFLGAWGSTQKAAGVSIAIEF
jgi:hypothetical protein